MTTAQAPGGENIQVDLLPHSEAPVEPDRSFLIGSQTLDLRAVGDSRPRVPVNPATGLAYPLILPPRRLMDRWTKHHHNFPASYVGGHAIRHIYVQKTFARLHNDGPRSVHSQYSIPTTLPETPSEQRGAFVMGVACHIPHEGLDLFSGDPRIRCMTRAEEQRLKNPGIWGLTSLQTDLDNIPEAHMRWRAAARRTLPGREDMNPAQQYMTDILLEFMPYIDCYERRSNTFEATSHPEVGFAMLRAAARLLVENTVFYGERLVDKYDREKQQGRLRPDSPAECADLLVGVLGSRGGLAVVFDRLKIAIQEERGISQNNDQALVA